MITVLVLTLLVFGLPLAGAWIAGLPLHPYLQFPPLTVDFPAAPFHWAVFAGMMLFTLSFVLPFVKRSIAFPLSGSPPSPRVGTGAFLFALVSLSGLAASWFLAWTRFDFMKYYQLHTFAPLWFFFILSINAILLLRTGRSPLTHRPLYFLILFPLSAAFWWYFEYLNRFVRNWYYTGTLPKGPLTAWEYFWASSVSFATVLPGVLSVKELLASFARFDQPFKSWKPLSFPRLPAAAIVFAISTVGLFGIGWRPAEFYPFLWLGPAGIAISFQALIKREHAFREISRGDWRPVVQWSVAALICGLCWEMWNAFSDAQWHYNVPYVGELHLFEMPLMGYAGYIPFGWECLIAVFALEKMLPRFRRTNG